MNFTFKYLDHSTINHEVPFHLTGVGSREKMLPGIVNRPQGTGDWLMMLFYEPVTLKVAGNINHYPVHTLMIWDQSMGHYYGNDTCHWTHSWLHFCGYNCHELLKEADFECAGYELNTQQIQVFEDYLQLMYHERVEISSPSMIIQQNLFQNLCIELNRSRSEHCQQTIPEKLMHVKHFVDQNFDKKINLKKLAKLAAISIPHLAAEFKKHFSCSPIDYAIKLRIKQAEYLLKDQNLSVSEIAERLGYHDHFHFSKQFKKFTNVTPSAFRSREYISTYTK